MSDWAIWAALILSAAAAIGAITLLTVRARDAWRAVKDARRDVVRRLDDLSAKAEATADRATAAGDATGLQESLGRLRVSLDRLAVLRSALDEARVSFARVTAVVPHK
ncbi:MAG TPA: hypothetical protein VIR14_01830 [Gaiellaceae bacterium]